MKENWKIWNCKRIYVKWKNAVLFQWEYYFLERFSFWKFSTRFSLYSFERKSQKSLTGPGSCWKYLVWKIEGAKLSLIPYDPFPLLVISLYKPLLLPASELMWRSGTSFRSSCPYLNKIAVYPVKWWLYSTFKETGGSVYRDGRLSLQRWLSISLQKWVAQFAAEIWLAKFRERGWLSLESWLACLEIWIG